MKEKNDTIRIEVAGAENFREDSLDNFRRYQEVHRIYELSEGGLRLVSRPFSEDWTVQKRRLKARDILSGEYITFCAFDGGRVVGLLMLACRAEGQRMIVRSFYISEDYRRMGIGRALLAAAAAHARSAGMTSLYISACPAEETVRFYQAMGCRLSSWDPPAHVHRKPHDIPMELLL
ncbi:MAG: GNAT family N-acetyltransferase [Lachnospiraceae bacterium]|nr:GNAT family N-acetyltransferase [Lachnospiraceae bacterium]